MPPTNPSTLHPNPSAAALPYDPALSLWLSVDPLSDKYPNLSPYVYCANNPVRLVDVDGREVEENLDKWRFNTSTGRLSWLSDEGGVENQTVEFVHNESDGELHYNSTKAVNYNGTIGDMFDFSVISSKIDGITSGALDIFNGAETFVGGVGLGVATEGAATPAAVSLCFAGGAQLADGFKTLASALSGENGKYGQQDLVKDLCKTGVNFASNYTTGFNWKNLFQSLKGATVSTLWSQLLYKKANYPKFKGNPPGSRIIYSH